MKFIDYWVINLAMNVFVMTYLQVTDEWRTMECRGRNQSDVIVGKVEVSQNTQVSKWMLVQEIKSIAFKIYRGQTILFRKWSILYADNTISLELPEK